MSKGLDGINDDLHKKIVQEGKVLHFNVRYKYCIQGYNNNDMYIINTQGQKLKVETLENEGSVFRIQIPIA